MIPARGPLPAAGVLALLLVAGCAGPSLDVPAFQDEIARGDYPAALERIEARDDEDDVADLLDRALLYSAMGEYGTSNALFEIAEHRIADLYTRSLTDEGLSILVNDWMLDYRAAAFEHAYISYFRAWNYLEQGDAEGALVEVRKIDERLRLRADDCSDAGGRCGHDAFLRYFCGLVYEWAGRDNDALVSYRLAEEAASTGREFYGVEPPADLQRRRAAVARRLGVSGRPAAGTAPARFAAAEPETPRATVAVFVETGMVGVRRPVDIVLPIFKGETSYIEDDPDEWAHTLADRAYVHYDEAKLDYLLRVSIPTFVAPPPSATDVRFAVDGEARPVPMGTNLTAQAELAFQAALGGILVRAVARGITKYLLKETAEDEVGWAAGLAVNLFGVVTENADTRSWRALPSEIHVATFPVGPGPHEGELILDGPGGAETVPYGELDLEPGEIAFVRYRTGR